MLKIISGEMFFNRLTKLRSKVKPGDFLFLFALIEEFGDIGKLIPDLDVTLLPDAVMTYAVTETLIGAVLNESGQKLMLDDIGSAAPLDGSQQRAWVIARALRTSAARFEYLHLMHCSFEAFVCANVLKRRSVAVAWRSFVRTVWDFPAFAPLVQGVNIQEMCEGHAGDNLAKSFRLYDFELIDLTIPEHILIVAGGEFVRGINAGYTGKELADCRANLELILNFLVRTEGVNWSVEPIHTIDPANSLTIIVRELISHRFRRLDVSASPLREMMDRKQIHYVEGRTPFYLLCRGLFQRQQYIVELPPVSYLSRTANLGDANAWLANPLDYLKHHIDDIPYSVAVDNLRLRIARVEFFQKDLEAQQLTIKVLKHATAEALALALSRACGFPDEAIPILAGVLQPLIERFKI